MAGSQCMAPACTLHTCANSRPAPPPRTYPDSVAVRRWDRPRVRLSRRLSRDVIVLVPMLLLCAISVSLFAKMDSRLACVASALMVVLPAYVVLLTVKLMKTSGHELCSYSCGDIWRSLRDGNDFSEKLTKKGR